MTPDIAFTTLSLFNQIVAPLFILPFVINLFVNCLVSCGRLKTYFLAPEIEGDGDDDGKDFETTIPNGKGTASNGYNDGYQNVSSPVCDGFMRNRMKNNMAFVLLS